MKPFSRPALALAVALALLTAAPGHAFAQRLYDKQKDDQAEETQSRLDELASALDRAIMRQAWVDASIDILQGLFETASEVRGVTADHT